MTPWRRARGRSRLLAIVALLVFGAVVYTSLANGGSKRPFAPRILMTAKARNPTAFRTLMRAGAKIVSTDRGRSFAVVIEPRSKPRVAIVTLHGFKSSALDQAALWRRYAEARGWGLISMQWRQGFTLASSDDSPFLIYDEARRLLQEMDVGRDRAVLHGFSSGAIRTYGITALDRRTSKLFGLSIANSGAAQGNFPLKAELLGGRLGRKPLTGSHWVLFCGGKDPNPNYTGCPAMRASQTVIARLGAAVDLLLSDPRAGHAGFLAKAANVNRALTGFETRLAQSQTLAP